MLGLCARVAPAVTLAGGNFTPDHARPLRAFVVSGKGPAGGNSTLARYLHTDPRDQIHRHDHRLVELIPLQIPGVRLLIAPMHPITRRSQRSQAGSAAL